MRLRRRSGGAAAPEQAGPAPTPGSGIDPGAGDGAPPRFAEGPADVLLQRLELTVRRRLDGLLQGDHLGLVPGSGTEAGDSRSYHPGDDVRRMDWPVTARTQVPHVRETIADRELETWAVLDLSASLDFGTANCEKRDLAIAGLAAVSHLTVRGGNRLGAVVRRAVGGPPVRLLLGSGHTGCGPEPPSGRSACDAAVDPVPGCPAGGP